MKEPEHARQRAARGGRPLRAFVHPRHDLQAVDTVSGGREGMSHRLQEAPRFRPRDIADPVRNSPPGRRDNVASLIADHERPAEAPQGGAAGLMRRPIGIHHPLEGQGAIGRGDHPLERGISRWGRDSTKGGRKERARGTRRVGRGG